MKLDFPRKTTYIQIAGVTAFTHTVGNKKSLKWKKRKPEMGENCLPGCP